MNQTEELQAWQITPRDGLVLGDGRPFQTGLAASRSLTLPTPESLLGLVTTQRGLDEQRRFALSADEARTLKKRGVLRGPLLTQGRELIVPAPLDCVWSEAASFEGRVSSATAHRLTVREELARDENTPVSTLTSLGSTPLARPEPPLGKSKPLSGPAFWRWETMMDWLAGDRPPEAQVSERGVVDETRFIASPLHERRMHVSLEHGARSALDGALFITPQVSYVYTQRSTSGDSAHTMSLTFWAQRDDRSLREGVAHLGGERKPSLLAQSSCALPTLPDRVASRIATQEGAARGVVRVTLLTPALFSNGSTPGQHLMYAPEGKRHQLVGWVSGRPQAISGWDLAKSRPKPHRRLAPAGSTYWIRVAEGVDPVEWARDIFMTSISDQDRNAGFGLCVTGVA